MESDIFYNNINTRLSILIHFLKRLRKFKVYREFEDILLIYFRKNGTVLAKGIAYSFLITSIPLLFITLYICSLFFNDISEVKNIVTIKLSDLIPIQLAQLIIDQVSKIALSKSWLKIGIVGFIGLFFVPRQLFASLDNSLRAVMESPKGRTLLKRQILYFILVISAATLFFFASYFYLIIKTVLSFIDLPLFMTVLGSKTISTIFISIALMLIYRICYHSSLNKSILFIVSTAIALIWQIVNFLGASIITISGKNEFIYGLLAGGIVFLFWAYIFAVLLLIGGVIIARENRKLKMKR